MELAGVPYSMNDVMLSKLRRLLIITVIIVCLVLLGISLTIRLNKFRSTPAPIVTANNDNILVNQETTSKITLPKAEGRMKIFTYYEEIPQLDTQVHQELVQLWQRNWWAAGFHPIVLGLGTAQKHPQYDELVKRFAQYPTVNDVTYELACYRRWLALHVVGGGIFTDYDMMAVGSPGTLQKILPSETLSDDLLTDPSLAPMFVVAGEKGVGRLIGELANYRGEIMQEGGRPHISDMIMLANDLSIFQSLERAVPIVHFSSGEFSRFKEYWKEYAGNGRKGQKNEYSPRRDVWTNEIVQLHSLSSKKTFFAIPWGTRPLRRYAPPKNMAQMLPKYLGVDEAFDNLRPQAKQTLLPGSHEAVLRILTDLPDGYNPQTDRLLVGFWMGGRNRYSEAVEKILTSQGNDNGETFIPIPLNDDKKMKLLLEFNLGFRINTLPTFRTTKDRLKTTRRKTTANKFSSQKNEEILLKKMDYMLTELKGVIFV